MVRLSPERDTSRHSRKRSLSDEDDTKPQRPGLHGWPTRRRGKQDLNFEKQDSTSESVSKQDPALHALEPDAECDSSEEDVPPKYLTEPHQTARHGSDLDADCDSSEEDIPLLRPTESHRTSHDTKADIRADEEDPIQHDADTTQPEELQRTLNDRKRKFREHKGTQQPKRSREERGS